MVHRAPWHTVRRPNGLPSGAANLTYRVAAPAVTARHLRVTGAHGTRPAGDLGWLYLAEIAAYGP